LAIAVLLFAMIFKILPSVDLTWHDVWMGAVVTALLFTAGKFAIGYYMGTSGLASPTRRAPVVQIPLPPTCLTARLRSTRAARLYALRDEA
jgi:Virulence factor BrkB